MNTVLVPNNQNPEQDKKENVHTDTTETDAPVAGCSLKQPVAAPPTQEELDRQAEELIGNFLGELYQSIEAEELLRRQQPDNLHDMESAQDWTIVR